MLQCCPPESWSSSHCEQRVSESAAARAAASRVRRFSMRTIVRTPSPALLKRLLDRFQVERVIQLDLQPLGAGVHVLRDALDRTGRNVAGPLALGRPAANLRAPLVDDLVFVANDVWRAARIRHVPILSHQFERDPLTAA